MALTACFECGGEVSDLAKACPHCGAPGPRALRAALELEGGRQPAEQSDSDPRRAQPLARSRSALRASLRWVLLVGLLANLLQILVAPRGPGAMGAPLPTDLVFMAIGLAAGWLARANGGDLDTAITAGAIAYMVLGAESVAEVATGILPSQVVAGSGVMQTPAPDCVALVGGVILGGLGGGVFGVVGCGFAAARGRLVPGGHPTAVY